jgi:nucleoside-diphosphate-sugar epimerase
VSPRLALVTGATGFVGSHLLEELRSDGVPVRALVRPTSDVRRCRELGVDVVAVDPADPVPMAHALTDVAVVYHLAAATRALDEAGFVRANVAYTASLMRAVRAAPAPPRVVFLGSLAAVGATRDGQPVGEDETPRPLTAYGRTKLEAERIVLGTEGVAALALRPPTVYGPRDRDLLTFFRMAARGIMPVPTGPDRPVQMIHARDLVGALRAAAESTLSHRVYHVAEPVVRPWSRVVALVAKAVGTHPLRVPVPRLLLRAAAGLSEAGARLRGRPGIFTRDKVRELLAPGWICTTERAWRELGFRASTSLEEGIVETAEWYRTEGWLSVAQ